MKLKRMALALVPGVQSAVTLAVMRAINIGLRFELSFLWQKMMVLGFRIGLPVSRMVVPWSQKKQ